jgi:hypothetical protein
LKSFERAELKFMTELKIKVKNDFERIRYKKANGNGMSSSVKEEGRSQRENNSKFTRESTR